MSKQEPKKLIRYGVVGFSRNQFDKKAATQILNELFQEIKRFLKFKNF